jgi:hypothetical protein
VVITVGESYAVRFRSEINQRGSLAEITDIIPPICVQTVYLDAPDVPQTRPQPRNKCPDHRTKASWCLLAFRDSLFTQQLKCPCIHKSARSSSLAYTTYVPWCSKSCSPTNLELLALCTPWLMSMSCIYSNSFPLVSSYIINCSQDTQTVGPLLFPEFSHFESTARNSPHSSVL